MMKLIAQLEHMNFLDHSAETKRDLKVIGALPEQTLVINMGVDREDGVGLGAGNLGLPGYQVVVGFSEGSNPPEAHTFADKVVSRLKTRWNVETVPAGKGALPLKMCGQQENNVTESAS